MRGPPDIKVDRDKWRNGLVSIVDADTLDLFHVIDCNPFRVVVDGPAGPPVLIDADGIPRWMTHEENSRWAWERALPPRGSEALDRLQAELSEISNIISNISDLAHAQQTEPWDRPISKAIYDEWSRRR